MNSEINFRKLSLYEENMGIVWPVVAAAGTLFSSEKHVSEHQGAQKGMNRRI